MNKLLIALLIVAAAVVTFFYLRKGKTTPAGNTIDKELLTGKWEPVANDSVNAIMKGLSFDFQKEGKLIEAKDSVQSDTAYYEWNKEGQLLFSDAKADSSKKAFSVLKLTKDSLLMKGKDSVEILLLKVKG